MDQTIKFERILEPFHESSQEIHIDKIMTSFLFTVLESAIFFFFIEPDKINQKIRIYFKNTN